MAISSKYIYLDNYYVFSRFLREQLKTTHVQIRLTEKWEAEKNNLCHANWLSFSNQANPTIIKKEIFFLKLLNLSPSLSISHFHFQMVNFFNQECTPPKKGWSSEGLIIQSILSRAIDAGNSVLMASVDLSKAFDIVNTMILRFSIFTIPFTYCRLRKLRLQAYMLRQSGGSVS